MGRHPHLTGRPLRRERDRRAIEDAIALCDIDHLRTRPIDRLSGGERQRVAIARCLAAEPRCCCSTSRRHISTSSMRCRCSRLCRSLASAGTAVAFATHDLGTAARFATDVILLREGRIVCSGVPSEVLTPSRCREVFGVDTECCRDRRRPAGVRVRSARFDSAARARSRSVSMTRSVACVVLLIIGRCVARIRAGYRVDGSVRDPQGAAIPRAEVRVTREGSGTVRTAMSGPTARVPGRRRFTRPRDRRSGPRRVPARTAVITIGAESRRNTRRRPRTGRHRRCSGRDAAGVPQVTQETSKAITIIDAQEIQARNENALSEIVRFTPGVQVRNNGGPGQAHADAHPRPALRRRGRARRRDALPRCVHDSGRRHLVPVHAELHRGRPCRGAARVGLVALRHQRRRWRREHRHAPGWGSVSAGGAGRRRLARARSRPRFGQWRSARTTGCAIRPARCSSTCSTGSTDTTRRAAPAHTACCTTTSRRPRISWSACSRRTTASS